MMGAGNYPVRVANGLHALGEASQPLYLKLLDMWQGWTNSANETRCFLAAHEYEDRVGATLDHIFRFAPGFVDAAPDVLDELRVFCSERWRHNFMEAV